MLDWIFEGIVTWISSVVSDMMDAVSGLFLQALGTDMTAMEEYFPFVSKAFTVMQYTAWALLFLITVWQLFRVFGGPVTEAENPWVLLGRSALFAFLIGYAKPIFLLTLKIATAPYTALMDIQMTAEDFTFAGIEQALQNGLTSLIATRPRNRRDNGGSDTSGGTANSGRTPRRGQTHASRQNRRCCCPCGRTRRRE